MVRIFARDDEDYLAWVASNQNGYVLNTYRPPAASYAVLHRATCSTISGKPARGKRWTDGYTKVCSQSRGEAARLPQPGRRAARSRRQTGKTRSDPTLMFIKGR
ncbi:hypothetical protein BMS3Bbin01_02058 [bacterium BMS3Bbin01]|nr:hypothetical protein BMS3Bbin01_02058 [bacterium BMS3Bbin01]